MTEDTSTQASAPAAEHTQPASAPAEQHQEHYQEQPAHETPTDHEHFTEDHDEPADLGEILEDRPKKLSGAQRPKLQRQHLESQLQERDSHIAERDRRIQELEAYVSQDDEARRRADTRRKHEAAHNERVSGAKETIADWDQVMAPMQDVAILRDLPQDEPEPEAGKAPRLPASITSPPAPVDDNRIKDASEDWR